MGGAYCAQQITPIDGSRMIVTRRSKRRRPSRTRSQLAIPSRSARSVGVNPRSASQSSTSAGRTRWAPVSADDMARGVYPRWRRATADAAGRDPATRSVVADEPPAAGGRGPDDTDHGGPIVGRKRGHLGGSAGTLDVDRLTAPHDTP